MAASSRPRFCLFPTLALTGLVVIAGCVEDEETAKIDGTLKADGYALFVVDNDRQQRNDVTVTVREADPGATYVLLYSEDAPRNVGWFLFDPTQKSRCGGATGPHCEIPGFGYMVDVVTVPEGATEVTLRDGQCGCDADNSSDSWAGHWAVMRIERTNRTHRVTFDVKARKVKDFVDVPEVRQLQ